MNKNIEFHGANSNVMIEDYMIKDNTLVISNLDWMMKIATDFEANKEAITKEVIALCEKYPIYK